MRSGRNQVLAVFLVLVLGGYLILYFAFRDLMAAPAAGAIERFLAMRRELLLFVLGLCAFSVVGSFWSVRRQRWSAASGFRVAMIFSLLLLCAVLLIFWRLL